jgi:hypothetical protein
MLNIESLEEYEMPDYPSVWYPCQVIHEAISFAAIQLLSGNSAT